MRGIFFTLDALIATGIASTVILVMLQAAPSAHAYAMSPLFTQRLAQSGLQALDESGELGAAVQLGEASSKLRIYAALANFMPPGFAANATVATYYSEEGASCDAGCRLASTAPVNGFCKCSEYYVSFADRTSSANATLVSSARRMFYSSERFGIATLEVWPS
ncbi:MAG: hypothetical protein AABW54_00750 [Candidatus Micrarchaeota archaeon]